MVRFGTKTICHPEVARPALLLAAEGAAVGPGALQHCKGAPVEARVVVNEKNRLLKSEELRRKHMARHKPRTPMKPFNLSRACVSNL